MRGRILFGGYSREFRGVFLCPLGSRGYWRGNVELSWDYLGYSWLFGARRFGRSITTILIVQQVMLCNPPEEHLCKKRGDAVADLLLDVVL